MKEHGARRVLMHAFDGSAKNAQAGIDAGFYFSIPPSFAREEVGVVDFWEVRWSWL